MTMECSSNVLPTCVSWGSFTTISMWIRLLYLTLFLILIFGHGTPEEDVLDPPEDCFRVRLVITLLETCGHYFDRGIKEEAGSILNSFSEVHFEQKGAVPLDIEFDLQDLFADLRPNMTLYSSIEEANAALLVLEEHEHTASTDKTSAEKHPDTEKDPSRTTSGRISANGQKLANGVETNGEAHEEVAEDTESDSGSGTVDPDIQDYEEDLDEENHDYTRDSEDNYSGGGDHGSDEDDEVHVRQKVTKVDSLEEAEFDREFRALLQESLESRKLELWARPTLNMMIPMNVFEGPTKDHHGRGIEAESGDEILDEEGGGSKEVRVKVLVKRSSKQQAKQMFIPRDSSLVQSTKQKEAAELEEKQDIKRLVLEYNDREEEELNGLGNQPSGWTQTGGGRVSSRGPAWEGHAGWGSGSRHRYHQHSGGGFYYARRR